MCSLQLFADFLSCVVNFWPGNDFLGGSSSAKTSIFPYNFLERHSGRDLDLSIRNSSRCLLVEIQALTAAGFLGNAKRKVSGLDGSRLAMLIAVLEKRGGLRLADQDIFASSVGGMKVAEPASDLALALAISGAFAERSLPPGTCAVGEIGLGGEVRHCQQIEQRIRESARLGFTRILAPADAGTGVPKGAELVPIKTLDQALEQLG